MLLRVSCSAWNEVGAHPEDGRLVRALHDLGPERVAVPPDPPVPIPVVGAAPAPAFLPSIATPPDHGGPRLGTTRPAPLLSVRSARGRFVGQALDLPATAAP
jgi:hypothetical protein